MLTFDFCDIWFLCKNWKRSLSSATCSLRLLFYILIVIFIHNSYMSHRLNLLRSNTWLNWHKLARWSWIFTIVRCSLDLLGLVCIIFCTQIWEWISFKLDCIELRLFSFNWLINSYISSMLSTNRKYKVLRSYNIQW